MSTASTKNKPMYPPEDGMCPYCKTPLQEFEPNPYQAWPNDIAYCPSNDCSYFRHGRKDIAEKFQKNFGYRYCWDPVGEAACPLIAWCPGTLSYLKGRCPA